MNYIHNIRVLVITMYCGEPQVDRCISSVKKQINVSCDHFLINNKPNIEAHKELYCLINDNIDNYDYFVKLDADMEFSQGYSLSQVISKLNKNTDHLTIPVFDFMTDSDMPDLHLFSNRVFIDVSEMNNLFVDRVKIEFPGEEKKLNKSEKLVYHCRFPTTKQATAFGYHRALKLCQYESYIPSLSRSKYHFQTLKKLYICWKRYPERKELEKSLLAACKVFSGDVKGVMSHKSLFTNVEGELSNKKLDNVFNNKRDVVGVFKVLGVWRFSLGLASWMINKTKSILLDS